MSRSFEHPVDEPVRGAVTAPRSNWILRAPAGSGKTTLLVTRYLELLSRVDKPEEILAITFTRKATAEMRERILASLKDPHSASPEKLADAARRASGREASSRWELIANPSRLKIQTIESFRRSLVEASPIEARIAPHTGLVQDARHLYEEAVERVFARVAKGSHGVRPMAALLELEQFNQTRVKRQLVDLLARRDQWRPGDGVAGLSEAPQWLREKMQALWSALISQVDAHTLSVLFRDQGVADLESPRAWRRIANLCLTARGSLRKRPPQGLDDEQKSRLRALLAALEQSHLAALRSAKLFPDTEQPQSERVRIAVIEACLGLARVELEALFKEHGFIDLVELGFGATRSLGSEELPTDLIIALDYSIKHILVDEFQDTSVTQANFLHSLVREWMPGEDRSLFAVGDPMQSIYGFREAEVGLFHLAEQEGMGRLVDTRRRAIALSPAKLETNFRSSTALVDWVNAAFRPAMERPMDIATGAVAYAPAVSIERDEAAMTRVGAEVHLFGCPTESAPLHGEARFIATSARKLLKSNSKYQVAILLRNRTQAPILLQALRDQGLDHQGSELDRLADEPAVHDLLTLAGAIAKPHDRLSNFSFLRSPVVGLTLHALHALARRLGNGFNLASALLEPRFLSQLTSAEREAVERTLPRLRLFREEYQKQPPRPLLERAWVTTGLAAVHADRRSQESVEALLTLIEAQGTHWIDFGALDRSLSDLYATASTESRLLVMTIHQAKGLEFDHVLLPFTSGQPRADERPGLLWRQTPEGLLAATRKGSGEDGSMYDWLEHEHKARVLSETERVLYVAVTRARKSLIMTATLPKGAISTDGASAKLSDKATPKANTLIASIWQTVVSEATLHVVKPDKPKPAAQATDASPLQRLPRGWTWRPAREMADIEVARVFRLGAEDDGLSHQIRFESESWVPGGAVAVGNVVHEALRWLSEHPSDKSRREQVTLMRPLIRRWLLQSGTTARLEAKLTQIMRELARALENKDCQWLLKARGSARSEAPFAAIIDGRLTHVRIDRTFVEDGIRHIIDYKTARRHRNEPKAAFRARQIEAHTAQLERYATVFRQIEDLPIIAALFLTSTSELVTVPLCA